MALQPTSLATIQLRNGHCAGLTLGTVHLLNNCTTWSCIAAVYDPVQFVRWGRLMESSVVLAPGCKDGVGKVTAGVNEVMKTLSVVYVSG